MGMIIGAIENIIHTTGLANTAEESAHSYTLLVYLLANVLNGNEKKKKNESKLGSDEYPKGISCE
jgi:hypothetical protein